MRVFEEPGWRLVEMLVGGDVDPSDYVVAVFERIEKIEGKINAYITVRERENVEQEVRERVKLARKGKRLPLAGVLVAVKDNINVKGLKTTCASRMLSEYVSPYNATVVERLIEAGAVVVGKTNMDEFAMGSTGETSAFGPTRNPWSLDRVPGGSSSGSAAALASGMATLALGSDTGGSIRLPSAWTGLYGLKPTYGLVSRYGLVAYAESLEQIGPMARNARDLALLLEVIGGFDPRDSTSLNYSFEPGELVSAVERFEEYKFKVALLEDLVEHEGVDERVRKLVYAAANCFEEFGWRVERVQVGEVVANYALPAYYVIAMSEASSNLARYDNLLYGFKEPPKPWESWNKYYARVRGEGFGLEVKRRIMLGSWMLSAGYRDQYYVRALRVRRIVRDRLNSIAEKYDVLLLPSAVVPPPRLGEVVEDPVKMYMLDLVNVQANLAGLPALTVPVGVVESVPMGVQLMARYLGEKRLLIAARVLEEKFKLNDRVAQV